jgi:hypothetical protein
VLIDGQQVHLIRNRETAHDTFQGEYLVT